jgi:hypothetical protein
MRMNYLSLVMMQLGMATVMVMVSSATHATGVAASGMSSNNLGAKGEGRTSRSRRSSRQAALYRQIKSMLQQYQGVRSGDQSCKINKLHRTARVDSRINAKQYKKVGYEDAKSWMECRLANIKSGIPNWAATDLASQWSEGLKHRELDETIVEIEAINLANQLRRAAPATMPTSGLKVLWAYEYAQKWKNRTGKFKGLLPGN